MESQKAFGRRAGTQPQSRTVRVPVAAMTQSVGAVSANGFDEGIASPVPLNLPARDEELEEWKRNRQFQIPWRQLSFMASLCFGVASLILPASVNNTVDWLLYALMAASFIAGISRRRKKVQKLTGA